MGAWMFTPGVSIDSGGDVDLGGGGLGWRDRVAVASQALKMELDRFAHLRDDFIARGAGCNAAREVRSVCRVVVGSFLDDDGVLHGF